MSTSFPTFRLIFAYSQFKTTQRSLGGSAKESSSGGCTQIKAIPHYICTAVTDIGSAFNKASQNSRLLVNLWPATFISLYC